MCRKLAGHLALLLWLLAGVGQPTTRSAGGLAYWQERRTEPRPLQIHVLRFDLRSEDYRLTACIADDPDGQGPAEASLTKPMDLARRGRLVAGVNANAFRAAEAPGAPWGRGWVENLPVDIHGWALSESRQASAPEAGYDCFWIDLDGRPHIGTLRGPVPARVAVAGFSQLLREGKVVAKQEAALHPRTAVGFDREGRYIYLVVVDGRQPGYSEGMSLIELAELTRELGCHEALNLDGGGSSIMIVADESGQLAIRNRPSDRGTRPVPVILGIEGTRP